MRSPFRFAPTLASRYILRAHIGPFFFSFITIMFVLLLQFIMRFIDQLVGKGLSAWVIMEVIALSLAWIVVLAVPMSVLVATLMAFGDMSSKNEITAMKASGMSIYRMMSPVMVSAVFLGILLIYFNNAILPEANHRFRTLSTDIRRTKPTLSLVAGLFSQDIPGYSILVRKTFEHSNELEGITLYDYTNPNTNITITAEQGTISFSPDYRKLVMDLRHGEIHELDLTDMESYRRIRFEKHRITMNAEGFEFERSSEGAFSRGDRELSAAAMLAIVDSLGGNQHAAEGRIADLVERDFTRRLSGRDTSVYPTTPFLPAPTVHSPAFRVRQISSEITNELFVIESLERQKSSFMVEVHKKYSIPAACLVFVLIGIPLGVMSRRGGFGIAATLSLGFFIVYWACLIGGEKLADRGLVSPFWGMWLANVTIGILGIILTVRIGRETVFISWDALRALVPRRWRADLEDDPDTAGTSV